MSGQREPVLGVLGLIWFGKSGPDAADEFVHVGAICAETLEWADAGVVAVEDLRHGFFEEVIDACGEQDVRGVGGADAAENRGRSKIGEYAGGAGTDHPVGNCCSTKTKGKPVNKFEQWPDSGLIGRVEVCVTFEY